MKVSAQPMSAFAVYSEKLKQKKKKSKPQVSNGINKLSKAQVPSSNLLNKTKKSKPTDKKTQEMKEIGYILRELAKRSADTSSPRAATLLNSISEANQKLDHDESAFLESTLKNVIVVDNLKKKSSDLKRKKAMQSVHPSEEYSINHLNLKTATTNSEVKNGNLLETNFRPSSSTNKKKLTTAERKSLKFKKLKASLKEQHIPFVTPESKAGVLKEDPKLTKRKNRKQLQIKSVEMGKGKQRAKFVNIDTSAKKLFEWLILPVLEKNFMSDFWEKKPLLIQREGNRNYFSELLSTEILDTMLRENNVCFTKHLDVTSYTDGVRETHNLTGRAQANVVWDFYSNGCSVRLLNPQIFLPKVHALNATLQEYFGCFVGANVYLTPPGSQGFAPHYDDIEAFVLQVEGKKQWKVYTPRNDAEVLPRFSSRNFRPEEIGEPLLDVTLEPGDLLYFPRGFIHQAATVDGEHSLHVTLSAYQKTAWVDLLEKVLPVALKRAAESDVEFRRGLPRDYLGLEYRGSDREKQKFVDTAQSLMTRLGHFLQLSLGVGVDQMGAQFMHDALPPVLTPGEKVNTSVGGGLKMKNGKLEGRVDFQMDTSVKLIRYNICRLVEDEGDEVRLYHCLDNSLEYHGEEPQFLVLPPQGVGVITQLQQTFPAHVCLQDLPHEDPEELIALVSDLWDAGLLSAKNLQVVEES